MVNINSATAVELQTLQGIGPRKAATIIDHRKVHGQFKEIQQLLYVNGIGPRIFQQISPHVTV